MALSLLYALAGVLVNILPVDIWGAVLEFFHHNNSKVYYKIVPAEGSKSYVLVSLLLGLVLIVYSKIPDKNTDFDK